MASKADSMEPCNQAGYLEQCSPAKKRVFKGLCASK
jgi:hypothetical protein